MKPLDKLFSALKPPPFHLLVFLMILLAGIALFSNVYSNSFHLDDFHTLVSNNHIHSLKEIPSFFVSGKGFSGTPYVSGYRPVTLTVNALNYAVSQRNPFGYHLLNLIVHLFSSFLVYQIALLLSNHRGTSLLSGVLFLVHPMNTEVVNYISSRSSSLSALFYLTAFWGFLHYRKNYRKKWLMISLIAFIFSLLSKEAAITLPFLLIAYDYFYFTQDSRARKVGVYLSYFSLAVLFLIIRYHLMTGTSSDDMIPGISASSSYFTDTAKNIFLGSLYLSTHYLFLYLVPYPLTIDHPFPDLTFNPVTVFFLLFWVLIFFTILFFRRKQLAPFLLTWFMITLLPVFLLPGITTLSLFQENRSYLSGAGICIFLAWAFIKFKSGLSQTIPGLRSWMSVFLFLWLIGLFYESYLRNEIWKSEITLWEDAYEKNPSSFLVSFSLGYGYLNEQNLDQARFYFNKSLELTPSKDYLYYIHNNLGAVYDRQGNSEKAFQEYQIAKNLSPRLPEAHLNLGLYYSKEGEYEKAEEEMETAMDLEVSHMEQRVQTAIEMETKGGKEAARRLLLKISTLLPASPEYLRLRNLVEEHLKPHEPD